MGQVRGQRYAVMPLLALLLAACGSQRNLQELQAAAGSVFVGGSPGPASATTVPADRVPGARGGAGPVGVVPGATAGPTADDPLGPVATGSRSVPVRAPRGPLVIGSVGALSGPASFAAGETRAVQIWARAINTRGGLNGQQVQVVSVDDASDPARYTAALQQLVEQQHVVAFVGNPNLNTAQSGLNYLERKKVPMIGGDVGSQAWVSSPMMFPQATAGDSAALGIMAAAAKAAGPGKKKVGWIYCQEAQICQSANRDFPKFAARLGLEVVYHQQTSVTQPDFTAECLGARNAGVEILLFATDPSSARRAAQGCNRQDFHPQYGLASMIDDLRNEDTLDGATIPVETFPWFSSATAAEREFQDAVRRYGSGVTVDRDLARGWVAAKLLEKAVLGARPDGAVTSSDILKGLWALKGETLGGLTSPLTFPKGRNAPVTYCSSAVRIHEHRWQTLPGADRLVCMKP